MNDSASERPLPTGELEPMLRRVDAQPKNSVYLDASAAPAADAAVPATATTV